MGELLAEQGCSIQILGYSQGGIPALACALRYVNQSWFEKCILLNNATMFWPAWLDRFLPEGDWWQDGFIKHPEWKKFHNWVIRNDPISDGMPGAASRAPMAPGITNILPSKATGNNPFENHALVHFLPSS